MNWVVTNWEDIAELTRQHLELALPPILFSLLIAIPIGRYAFSHPLFGRSLLNAASLMYAVPSLPLIITIPIIIGTPLRSNLTMITALTVYGVALLVRTAADAFASVDAHTRDAALALGHSPAQSCGKSTSRWLSPSSCQDSAWSRHPRLAWSPSALLSVSLVWAHCSPTVFNAALQRRLPQVSSPRSLLLSSSTPSFKALPGYSLRGATHRVAHHHELFDRGPKLGFFGRPLVGKQFHHPAFN